MLKSHFTLRNYTITCLNHTLWVEVTLVRIKITVVSVVITFARFKITLRVEITLSVWKSHSACENRNLRAHSCVLRSHFTFRNYTQRIESSFCV
jgi:hypothetical protein